MGPEFRYEILSKEDWYGRRLIAKKFRDARVFLGDAAHIWVPIAGYGMNAGIGDAMDLSWLLCRTRLNGWAPAGICSAYEAERWPITEQVSRFAMAHAGKEIARRGAVPAMIEAPGAEGTWHQPTQRVSATTSTSSILLCRTELRRLL